MAVDTGTRPGTKPKTRIPGSDYLMSEGQGWKEIREDDREVQRYESGINGVCDALEKALYAANIAYVMLHGGHVDKGKLARSGLRKDMEPGQVMAHIQQTMPSDIAAKALKP